MLVLVELLVFEDVSVKEAVAVGVWVGTGVFDRVAV